MNYKKKEGFLKNEDGSSITTDEELARNFRNQFDKLLNCVQPVDVFPPIQNSRNDQIHPNLTLEEFGC